MGDKKPDFTPWEPNAIVINEGEVSPSGERHTNKSFKLSDDDASERLSQLIGLIDATQKMAIVVGDAFYINSLGDTKAEYLSYLHDISEG